MVHKANFKVIEILLIIEPIIVQSLIKSDLKFMTRSKFVEFVQRPNLVARCKVQKSDYDFDFCKFKSLQPLEFNLLKVNK